MNIDLLQRRLKELGKTQANLASFLGRDPAAISRAMKGERQFKDYEIAQIAKFLELPIEHLLEEGDDSSTIAQNLKHLREQAGLSVRDMAEELGFAASSTYAHYEHRYKKPSLPVELYEQVKNVLLKHNVPEEDIETGIGFGGKIEIRNDVAVLPESISDFVFINRYDVSASAGSGAFVDTEAVVGRIAFHVDLLKCITHTNKRYLAVITVSGDSMEPTLKSGDSLLVDTSETSPRCDGIYIIRYMDALMVKRISVDFIRGVATITSDNIHYRSIENIPVSEIAVIGRVIWMGKQL